ncbi:MAG: dihydrolipoamide acetyltransferase family protein, partial [Aurantimonas coralicida]
MGTYTIKLPDVGEGVAEAELVEWHVKIGDVVREDAVLAAVMTDKATVDIPSPVDGTVAWMGGEIGETLAVGSPLVKLTVDGESGTNEPDENPDELVATSDDAPRSPSAERAPGPADRKAATSDDDAAKANEASADKPAKPLGGGSSGASRSTPARPRAQRPAAALPARKPGERPLASPAVRRRAMEAGIDLRRVAGSGPAGRIGQDDLDAYLDGASAEPSAGGGLQADSSVTEIKVVGLRRRIAEKMALAKSRIAHITYVEEIDVEALEELRAAMNRDRRDDRPKLTLLPFLMRAMVIVIREQPALNALYDDEANVLHQHGGVHIGIAAQTGAGLVVPVVRHAEARDLWNCAGELARLGEAAKSGTAKREEL